MMIDGRRIFVYSGEFHYWRLPSPQQWQDRLEKVKAAGLNAVSIYFDWQYHSNAPGEYDFTGIRDVNRLLSLTDRLGLYVIARVGPYMNAEVDAGGLPGWILTKPVFLRSQSWNGTAGQADYSPLYSQYSREWYDHLLPILARHQVTTGGSVLLMSIENEYDQSIGSTQYMQDLYQMARSDGITVPIFHNDFYFRGDWSKVVDLYAFDSYPYGFDCCHQWWDMHFTGMDTWEQQLRTRLGITTPMFVSELQGGAFDPWGGQGYTAVAKTLNDDWLNAIDQTAMAQGTSILNTYMFVGGTSWGYMTEPGVYTSYDYGAPISESGALRPAYYAAHRLGSFLQSFGPSLVNADAAPTLASASEKTVIVHSRLDGQRGTGFVFLRHGDAGKAVTTQLTLNLPGRAVTVPQKAGTTITVNGHGAETLLTNFDAGPLHANYSTSQVMMDTSTAQGQYLVLYGPSGSDGEIEFAAPPPGTTVVHNAGVTVNQQGGMLRLNYQHTAEPRTVSIQTSNGTLRLLITDAWHAARFWNTDGLILAGPDLVTGSAPSLSISMAGQRDVRVYGASPPQGFTVDGHPTALPDSWMGAIDAGRLSGSPTIGLPALTSWKFAPEAPEIQPGFDDSGWTPADHASTSNPNVPSTDTLLADDYGFHYGYVWYRGHFTATGSETGLSLTARQSYAVYLNGTYVGGADESLAGPPHPYATARTFVFPSGLLRPGQDNVIAVLTESLGHDEGWLAGPVAQSPQGILSASLVNGGAIAWRIQGDAGGEHPADTVRGLLNASGLFGERNGWYQPSFDDSGWQQVAAPDSWPARGMTSPVGWYRTHFQLNLPSDASVPLGLTIPSVGDKASIWLNGWLLGRYWQQQGPQHLFYLPQEILNPHGDNVLAIAVWNRGPGGGLTSVPTLTQYPSLQSHALVVSGTGNASSGYWHTSGNLVLDSDNRPVRIAGVNWFGMENKFFVPAGLDHQPLDSIMSRIAGLGFNTIRLPFSNQLVEENPVASARLDANPALQGLHALDLMDRIIDSAGRHGLRVILDDGRSSAGTQPETNGLWYTPKYPESSWIADWQTLVTRYRDNPTVVGVDLRNEPHTGPPGPWSVKTYLTQGATWGPYKGKENTATDWHLAAERGGNAVLAINPHLLILVEGIQQYPDPTWPGGVESYWWGGVLQPARQNPVVLDVPHQLVYSPHEYGPLKWQMPFFGPHMSYATQSAVWETHWGFLEKPTFPQEAPIVIGEFGTCGTSNRCIADVAPGSQGLWFGILMKYLKLHPEIGWSFWALNGTSHRGDPLKDYVLAANWSSLTRPVLVQTLRDIELPPPPG